MITRAQLSDLQGTTAYDEDRLVQALHRWHQWPPLGKEGHVALQSCMCGPVLVEEDGEGREVWQHTNSSLRRATQ